jgi:hypothetical protein
MSMLEEHLSDIANSNRKMDVRLTSVADKLSLLSSKIEVLADHDFTVRKIGNHPGVGGKRF